MELDALGRGEQLRKVLAIAAGMATPRELQHPGDDRRVKCVRWPPAAVPVDERTRAVPQQRCFQPPQLALGTAQDLRGTHLV